jgi:hypothetical protein
MDNVKLIELAELILRLDASEGLSNVSLATLQDMAKKALED